MWDQIAWNAYLLATITVHLREIKREYYLTKISFNHRNALCRALNSCIERDRKSIMIQKGFHESARLNKMVLLYKERVIRCKRAPCPADMKYVRHI